MPAIMTGLPDLRGRAEQRPRLPNVAVPLSEMDSVRAQPLGERDAVVDDEGNVRIGTDALQRLCKPSQLMLLDVLGAKLESRGKAGFKRCFQPVSEASADILRADQIELARIRG